MFCTTHCAIWTQGSWKVTTLGDAQNLTGHSAGLPQLTLLWVQGWTRQSPEVPWNLNILWFCIVTDLTKLRRMRLYSIQILVMEWKDYSQKYNQTQRKPLWPLYPILGIHNYMFHVHAHKYKGVWFRLFLGGGVLAFIVKISHAFLYQNCQAFYATINYTPIYEHHTL